MTNKRLDIGIDPEKQQLKQALGEDADDPELLGYAVLYTVGSDWNCLVPRDWLLERVNDLGLPEWLAPNKPRPHDAYKRAIKRMREDWLDREWLIEAPRLDNGIEDDHRVTVDLKEGDGKYHWHVRADVFFDEEECKQEGGKWVQHDLGLISYDVDKGYVRAIRDDGLGDDDRLLEVWEEVAKQVTRFYQKMQQTHIAQDIRKMMYYTTRDYTNDVIQLRRSVYLFPAGMMDFVDKMAQLYSDINEEFKTKGETVAVRKIEILDLADKREWIQEKVEETLEENLDSILSEAFEEFDEGEAADEIVKAIKAELEGDVATAETYNALLQAQIDVEQTLENRKQDIANSDHSDIIERVLSQTDFDDF